MVPDPFIGPTCDGSCAIDGGEALCLRRLEPEGVQQVRVSGRRDRHEAEPRQEADVADDALAPLELVFGERRRARDFIQWLLQQRLGKLPTEKVDYKARDDCTVVMVPRGCIGYVTGHKGVSLRNVEEESGTFCFIEFTGDDDHRSEDPKPLLIFGQKEDRL